MFMLSHGLELYLTSTLTSPASGIGTVVRHDSTANAYHTTVPCPSGR